MPETLTASFALDLEDGMSGPTAEAAGALGKLKEKIDADTKALREMQAAMKRLTSGTVSNVAAVQALQAKMSATKDSIAKAQSKYFELGGTIDGLGKKAKKSGGDMGGALSGLPGPIGQIASRFGALKGALAAGAIVGGLAAIAAAAFAVIGATVALTAALARYAITQADVRRNELLRLEGLTMLRSAYSRTAGSATEMQAAIDRVARSSALGRDQIAGMASGLHRAGLRGAAFRETMQSLATVEAALGQEGARRFRGRLIAEGRAGRSAEALERMQARFGALARRRGLALDVQTRKFHENISALFDDINIEGFLEGLQSIGELFSQNMVTGRALKAIVDTLVQPLINSITAGFPIVKRFFQGLVIGALIGAIAVLALRNKLAELFGDATILEGADAMRIALWGGVIAFGAIALALGVATVAALAFGAAMLIPLLPLFATIAAIGLLIYAGYRLVQWFGAQDWAAIGRSLVDGLVNGIRSAAGRVTGAMRDIARTARAALEGALGIESPSRVFAGLGMQIPRGLAQGVERGAPIAAAAVDDMASGTVPEGVSAASSTSVSVGPVTVLVQGGADVGGDELERRIVAALTRAFEGLAIHAGAPA
jgi:hypothetical protein